MTSRPSSPSQPRRRRRRARRSKPRCRSPWRSTTISWRTRSARRRRWPRGLPCGDVVIIGGSGLVILLLVILILVPRDGDLRSGGSRRARGGGPGRRRVLPRLGAGRCPCRTSTTSRDGSSCGRARDPQSRRMTAARRRSPWSSNGGAFRTRRPRSGAPWSPRASGRPRGRAAAVRARQGAARLPHHGVESDLVHELGAQRPVLVGLVQRYTATARSRTTRS